MAKAPAKKPAKNNLVEQIAKLPLAAKVGIFLGSLVLAGGGFYMGLYAPYSEEKANLEGAISSTQSELDGQQAALKKHQAVGQMKEAVDWSYQYMQQYLPQETEMPRLIQMVSEIGAKAGLTDGVTLFKPMLPGNLRDSYAEIPFTMRLVGEFGTVLTFLYDFSRMNRIVNITEVRIGSPTMVDAKREIMYISVDCSGSTYRSLTEAEAAAQKDPKKGRKG